MKILLKALAAAAALACSGMAAHAAPLDSLVGQFNWKFQGTTSEYSPVIYGGGAGNLAETTFGIGQVTQINQNNGDPGWTSGENGVYLYYVLYGIADLNVVGNSPDLDIYNVGCTGGTFCDGKIHLDIYRLTSPISGILLKDPDDRIGFGGFDGISNAAGGSLYMSWVLDEGKVTTNVAGGTDPLADETLTTLKQTAVLNVLPTSGTGTFFASVTGGSAFDQWNTNGFNGGDSDFDANFTLKPNFNEFGGACPDGAPANTCFLGLVNDPIQSNAVPEPGSLALAGLALAGIAGMARRRRTSAA